MEAWPFLISKSPGKDRKLVVLPEILKGEDAARLIPHLTTATLADGETKAGAALLLREVPHSTLGPLHVVFRNRLATREELGRAPDDLFPDVVTEGFVAGGAGPRLGYSQAHLDRAVTALAGRLLQSEQAKTEKEGGAFSALNVDLVPDSGPKIKLTAVHRSNGVARAHYEDLSCAWQTEARNETRRGAAVDKAGADAISWSERVRRIFPESGPKRALLFVAVTGVTLGGLVAWQNWKHRHRREQHTMALERL
jgi:hypothetical protein